MAYLPVLAVLLTATALFEGSRVQMGERVAAKDHAGTEQAARPDYSQVDSREKQQKLMDKGELVPVLLLPQAFGGDRRPENVVFVPRFLVKLKQDVEENIVAPLVREGKVKRYEVRPIYSGASLVPIALTIRAYDPANFNYQIAIWGQSPR